ncbi:MAG: histidine kinase dimerization/phosphoacceptor domain -containing protein [Flavobacteriales bacterium]
MPRSVAPVLLFAALCCTRVQASRGEDSLHMALHGSAGAAERAKALLELSARFRADRPTESLLHARTAMTFAQQVKDPALMHAVYAEQCSIFFRLAAYDDLLHTAMKASELAQGMGNARAIAEDLNWLSIAYDRMGEFNSAVDMSKRALVLLKTTGDSSAISKAILEVMNALVKAGRFDEVIHQGEEALNYFENKDDTVGRCKVQVRSAEALVAQGRFADALPLLHHAMRGIMGKVSASDLAHVETVITEAYCGLGRFQEAQAHLDSAVSRFRSEAMVIRTPRLLFLQGKVLEGMGDLKGALECQRQHATLKDSLMNERIADRMAGLTGLYDLRAKDAENAALKDRNQANEIVIQEAEARSKWLLVVSVVLLAVLVILATQMRRNRRVAHRARLRNLLIHEQAQEITKQNLDLQQQNLRLVETLVSEEEKDMLLREIHHRVKNNLQIVNALLRVQGAHLGDPKVEQLMAECQGRIRSIASVHELLYRAGDVRNVNIAEQLNAIAQGIFESYGVQDRLSLNLRVPADRFPIDTLTPLGLIVNELITNSVKHAFPGRTAGVISIALREVDGQYELRYNDNGPGPASDHFFGGASFGLELVRILSNQMGGNIQLMRGEETTLVLTFRNEARQAWRAAS